MSERIESLISKEALAQFEQLGKLTDANVSAFEKLIAKGVELNKQLGGATGFKDMNKAAAELTENEKALQKQQQELEKQQAKLNQLYSDEAKRIAELKVQQQARNKELATEVQLQNAANNSVSQAAAMIKKLTTERNNLDLATIEGRKRQAELNAEIDKYNKFITENSDKQEKQRRNVGNYGSALKTLEGYLADVRTQLTATQKAASGGFSISAPGPAVRAANSTPIRAADNKQQLVSYNQTVAQTTDRVQDLVKQEQLLSRIVESQMAGFASATAEIKNNEKALQALGAAGLQNTEFYQALLKDTAQLKDNVGDLKDEIKALASDTRQFDLFAGAVTGLVSALQVGASAAELFAGENEDVQKSIQRLVALQNISQGVQQIANDLTTKGTALNKLYNFIIGEGAKTTKAAAVATTINTVATEGNVVATEAATVATTGLATATKVLRAALIASGIGLLVAGVVYLVSKLQEWRDADINLIKHQAELNQVTLESIRLNKELADLTRTDIGTDIQALKNRVAAAQAYGKSQGEILAAEQALLKARQEAATIKFLNTDGAGELKELEKQLNGAAKALDDFNKQQAAIPEDDRDKKTADAQRALLQSTLDLTKEKYAEQRVIVDDYYNYNNEVIAKQLQIERLSADERRKYALETATISANSIIDANQRALNNEEATLKQRLALMQSTAEQQKRIARAQNENVQNDPGASANDRLLAAKNAAYQINKIEKDSLEAQRKLREEYRKRDESAELQILKTKLEDSAKANSLIAENESKSFDARTDALYAAFENRRSIIIAEYQNEIKTAGLTATERIAIEQKYLSDVNALTIEYGQQQQTIYQQNTDKVNDIIEKGQQARQDKIAGDAASANTDLIKQLVAGQITLEQYNRQREQTEHTARILSLKEEVNNATAKVLTTKEGTAARFEAEKELREKTLALNEEYNKKEIDAITKLNDLKKELAAESVETFNALVNSQFDNESARIQQQMDELDRQKEHDVLVANATIANKKEREAEVAKIELKAQLQREQLEKRQRQIELDRARFEKAANIAQIISSTALAIIEALKTYKGTPQAFAVAAAIGTIGALNLAKAIAAPLPKFAEGTTDAPGGLSLVGDGYRKELVITPQGKVLQTPSVPTVMNVPKHSIVLPDARAALEGGLMVNQQGRLVASGGGTDMSRVEQKLDTIAKTIKNKPVLNMNASQSGLTAMWNYGANWVTYTEDQVRF
jgi:hypothetical protein